MRVKGIKRVTVRKGGKTYVYYRHRATGERIKSEFDTAAFAVEAAALDRRAEKKPEPKPGSLGHLIAAYHHNDNPEWTKLSPRTRSDYERVFDYLKPIDDMPLIEATTGELYRIRDQAFRVHKRRFANYVVQVIHLLFEWGRKRDYMAGNPANDVDRISRPRGMARANRPWEDDEREAVLSAARPELRLMIALGMFVGLREGDACKIPKSGYDGSAITAIAAKNSEPLWIPAHFRLKQIIDDTRAVLADAARRRARRRRVVPIEPPTLAVSSRGASWTESGFRASFFKLTGRLERVGKVRPGLTFHGLRHTVGKLVIEAGGTARDVQDILSDRSEAMGNLYSRDYDRKTRLKATMKKLERIERKKMDKRTD